MDISKGIKLFIIRKFKKDNRKRLDIIFALIIPNKFVFLGNYYLFIILETNT